MAKKGMKRPENTHTQPRNRQAAVPEIQGKAKNGKEKAKPLIAGTHAPSQKVFHAPVSEKKLEQPLSQAYVNIDNDLARDNMENDLSAADSGDI